MEIINYIGAHWTEWLFTIIVALLGLGYRSMLKKLQEERIQSAAIAEGVQSLLRESIVSNYNKYHDKGFCPIYAKESMKKVYSAYHDLGGNDVATSLFRKLLDMPEAPNEDKEDDHEV